MYPEHCVQAFAEWLVEDEAQTPVRGRLVKTFVPYPGQKPHRLTSQGRTEDATRHDRALVSIELFRVGQPLRVPEGVLPVAALPLHPGEAYFVYRGKVRPALVLAGPGDAVPRTLMSGSAGWLTAHTLLVAPYYGKDPDGTRGGWPQPLADRIRLAEYDRFVWDKLPIPGPEESILRLDHIFPIGADPANYEVTRHRLSAEALRIVDEWVRWRLTGSIEGCDNLVSIRELLLEADGASGSSDA